MRMLQVFIQNKYTILLCSVLLNVIAAPFFSQTHHPDLFFNVTFSLIMLTAVLSVAGDKKMSQAASIVLMLPCMFFVWMTYFYALEEHIADGRPPSCKPCFYSTYLFSLFCLFFDHPC